MDVRILTPAEVSLYDALARENGKVFYGGDWRAILGASVEIHGVFGPQGALVGGFQLVEERRAGVRVLRNPPFTPVCGPMFHVEAKHPVAVLEARREVVEAMAIFLAGQPRSVVSLSLDHGVGDVMPFWWRGFKATPRYTYQIDLRRPLADIVKGFTATRRNDISKARRDGLTTEPANDLRVVYHLVKGTFLRQSARLDVSVLENILFRFARPDNSYAYVTRRGDRAIACTFMVHDRRTAYYLLGGYDAEDRHHGAGALAILTSIEEAQRRGLAVFDFEGSMIPAIERFFRGFGGELVHYFTVNRAWLPFELLLKWRKRSLF